MVINDLKKNKPTSSPHERKNKEQPPLVFVCNKDASAAGICNANRKQGLTHAQARSENKLHFHFNASLTAVYIAKAIYYLPLEKHLCKSFSMSNVKTLHLNIIVADRIFSNLDLDLSCEKKIGSIGMPYG